MAAHYILSQVLYREEEMKNELSEMSVFDIPDKTDFASILWKSGSAVGFYSIKATGLVFTYIYLQRFKMQYSRTVCPNRFSNSRYDGQICNGHFRLCIYCTRA